MWTYRQSTGALINPQGQHIAYGYSGKGVGKNNPQLQAVHNVGPIPCGIFDIGLPFDSSKHGPYCLPLTPHPENKMYGRDSFLCHGDSFDHPGEASEGCIILRKMIRILLGTSDDRLLQVVA